MKCNEILKAKRDHNLHKLISYKFTMFREEATSAFRAEKRTVQLSAHP